MRQPPKYKIYPSLLDKFTHYLETDEENYMFIGEDGQWHKNYNESTGEFRYSSEEVDELAKWELINAINRIRFDSEAADKGTTFNEMVDSFVQKRRSEMVLMKGNRADDTINAEFNGRSFCFSFSFVEEAARYFEGCMCQVYTEAILPTSYGDVMLYGYIDELRENKVYDIKTTKQYEFGKYAKYWQRHVYPYCLLESGMCTEVDSFEFTAYKLTGGTSRSPVINGVQYPEVYKYEHEVSKEKLTNICERFIEFLEENRELITDKKIFGGEKDG